MEGSWDQQRRLLANAPCGELDAFSLSGMLAKHRHQAEKQSRRITDHTEYPAGRTAGIGKFQQLISAANKVSNPRH